jgi:putative redox protein
MVESTALDERYSVELQAREHLVRSDTIKDGRGGNSGMRPHELLEAALASCMAITARMAADELGIPGDDIRVVAELERRERESVFRYRLARANDLPQDQSDAIAARIDDSPVRRTLSTKLHS